MHQSNRPLSPHLQIYKPQLTSVLSIFHRATGIALSFGLVLFATWLISAAYYPQFFESFIHFTGSIFGLILLFGWTVAFYYHFAAGLRHLIWDTIHLLEIGQAYKAGYAVLGFTFGASIGTWIMILWRIS